MSSHTDDSFVASRGRTARRTSSWIGGLRVRGIARLVLSPVGALTLLAAIACSGDDPTAVTQPVAVATVTVSPGSQTLVVGATATLTATLADAAGNPITGRPITWVSNNPAVATVTSSGVVTAIAEGVARIDGSSGGKYGAANIVVNRTSVARIDITPATLSLSKGETGALSATAKDANGAVLEGRAITWISHHPTVATVTAAGIVTAVAEGVAQIDASSEGQYGTANIIVTRFPVARVEITPATMSLVEGQIGALSASMYDANGAFLLGRAVTWSSSDASVATIDANGDVTAAGAGTVAMTAESEGKTATVQVTVRAAQVTSVVVSPLTQPIETGDVFSLTAVAQDAAGRALSRTITWSTSNAAVATIAPNGQVIVRGPGTVTLTATAEGKTGSVTGVADAPPAANLLYQRTTPLSSELFTLNLASGGAPAKINAGNVSHQPSVTGDGSRIAFFVSMTAQDGEIVEDIFAVDRVGTNMKRLTTTAGVDNAPAWSPRPGANLLAFHRLDGTTGRSDIWVMNGDGTSQRNLTADLPIELARGEPAWSPDGQWIAFSQSRATAGPGRGSIWIMRADGSEKRQLTSHPDNGFDLHPTWSPDGQRIAFQRASVAIVTVATGTVTYLNVPGIAAHPSWSPDGRHIAFTRLDPGPNGAEWQLYTVRADGTGMRLRTTNPLWGGGVSPTWIAR